MIVYKLRTGSWNSSINVLNYTFEFNCWAVLCENNEEATPGQEDYAATFISNIQLTTAMRRYGRIGKNWL